MPRSVYSVAAPPRRRPAEAAPSPTASAGGAPRSRWSRIDWWRIAPTLIAAALAAVYLYFKPRSPDLAAHIFRAELFGREGFTVWNGQWYGGHHTPAYSVLSPPLSWLLGPQLMGALSAVAATACFTELMRKAYGAVAARLGTIWFGIGSATLLFTNRLPFALGVAFGVAAVLAAQRQRRVLAPLLAILSAISSPVAGLFLAMGGVAHALANWRGAKRRTGDTDAASARARRQAARRDGLVLAGAAFIPPVLLTATFPEGGWAPFPFSSYLPIPLFALVCVLLLPREEKTLRWTAALYGLGATLALVLHTAMGGNAVRIGALVGGPLLACALWPRLGRRPMTPMIALLGALAFWQWSPAVRDIYKAIDDPVAKASYFDPLREYLALEPGQWRVEIPFTFGHWEGAEVASEAPLARGWLRQLDTGRHPIFYGDQINELTYASWLSENAVRFVALPDAKPDASSYRERALIESGLPYLRLRKRFDHWRIYEVTLPAPFVIPEGDARIQLEQLGSDRVLLRVRRPGSALVRVRWTPYWLAKGGCVQRAGEWTRVTAEKPGFLPLVTRFSPERIFQRGQRCNSS
ncbi:MAG TPA: hypothetical protein VHF90_05070 [Thermoleophilaceae bacterium]|nr:hypothetical protein [Thermoleophilaceae bacterium]